MASIIAGTLRQGKKARDRAGSDDHLSKVVELNGSYRLFFRTVEVPEYDEDGNDTGRLSGMRDVAVAVVPGRSLDYKVCNAGFISYTPDMYELDEAGVMKDKTGLQSFARIARVIHQAQCLREKKNVESEAKRTAEELGKAIDQASLARSLEGIELKYNGGQAADGTKINPSVSPYISGIQQKMTTQVLVVKLLPNGEPDFQNAQYATLEISTSRMNELIALMDKPEYFDNESEYMEVGYEYKGADKKAAGKAAKFQGISSDLRLCNTYSDLWASHGKSKVDGLAKGKTIGETAEILRSRNRNLRSLHTPQEIMTAVKKYCANNAAIFGSIDFESEDTRRATVDFLSSGLLDDIPAVKTRFEELRKEIEKEDSKGEDKPSNGEANDAAKEAETFDKQEEQAIRTSQEIMSAGEDAQSLAQIAQAAPNAQFEGDDESGLGDLD